MSSDDAFFWAGMAGGRQNRIDKLNDTIDEWEAHAAHLQRVINELSAENRALRSSRLVWLDHAIHEGGQAQFFADTFKKRYGEPIRKYVGEEKADKEIEKAKIEERKNGIGKKFNWNL